MELRVYVGWMDNPFLNFRDEMVGSFIRPTLHPLEFKDFLEERKKNPRDAEDVFVSNNPLFVDHFESENVYVVSKTGKIKKLSEHPRVREWCGTMKAGEFWTWAGEDWVDE